MEAGTVSSFEMIEIGLDSAWCEGGWCLAGDETVGGECDFFRFTEKRGVEELEEAGEAEQWVSASFGGEGDRGRPFEDFAIVIGELQVDFGVSNRHGLAGDALGGSSRSVGQIDAEQRGVIGMEDGVVRTRVEQATIGVRHTRLGMDHGKWDEWSWANRSSLKRDRWTRAGEGDERELELHFDLSNTTCRIRERVP